jgi:hypothetical protein
LVKNIRPATNQVSTAAVGKLHLHFTMATGGAKKKGKNLSEAGEEQVTRSWLNVAQDADVGTDQKSDAFF